MGSRLTWSQIQSIEEYRGSWVALDKCKYDGRSGQPTEGSVIDHDPDLIALCSRMQASSTRHCAILFCGGGDEELPSTPSAMHRVSLPAYRAGRTTH